MTTSVQLERSLTFTKFRQNKKNPHAQKFGDREREVGCIERQALKSPLFYVYFTKK